MNEIFEEGNLDPELVALFKLLRETKKRNLSSVAKSRAKFISELDLLMYEKTARDTQGDSIDLPIIKSITRRFEMLPLTQRLAVLVLAGFLVVFGFLFGGAGLTARAAKSSLPGDALYPIKTTIEQAQLKAARDLEKEADLYMEFASRRLDEMEKLVEAGRYELASEISQEFQTYVGKALEKVEDLAEIDPEKSLELNFRINQKLSEFFTRFDEIISRVPESFRPLFSGGISLPPVLLQNDNDNSNDNSNNNNVNTNDNDNDNDDDRDDNNNDDDRDDNSNDDDRDDNNNDDDRDDNDNDDDRDDNDNDNDDDRDDNDNDDDRDDNNNDDDRDDNDNDRDDNDNDDDRDDNDNDDDRDDNDNDDDRDDNDNDD